tara:strand:- start:586 stop:2400 length:1815 start_codon:yes stop_codon:yes gene_type:complete
MKRIFYIFIIFQLAILFKVEANKLIVDLLNDKSLRWEKYNNEKEKINKIFWKSYQDDESYFHQELDINNINWINNNDTNQIVEKYFSNDKVITHINSFFPLNNFLNPGNFQTTINWKSSFDGGESQGTGQQNPLLLVDFGFTDDSNISFYFTEADDNLFNRINGDLSPYSWQSYALSYKKRLFDNKENKVSASIVSTIEYWKISSGGKNSRSIFNNKDDSFGKEKYENLIGAFSFPITKEFNKKVVIALVPGVTFLPDRIGSKNIGKNAYGNNFYLGAGIVWNILDNLKILSSFTNPLGPGRNYFDRDLNFSNKSIYSYGLSWDVNQKIGIEGRITNSFGETPSTGLLTIPSDNKPLYSANLIYNPYGLDNKLNSLSEKDNLISFGGITVNNALIQDYGKSQGILNYDTSGNAFFSYKYSLSNIFQLELLNIGQFNDINNPENKNLELRKTYINNNNLNFRLGGKLMLFSPQKNDRLWSSLRTSFGRNNNTNQGYIYSEFLNTIRVNSWLATNISPKYFFSGIDSFGSLGISKYINLGDKFLIIPEINIQLSEGQESNKTISFRYSYSPSRSIDLYYSNAIGIQDLGQNLKGKDKFGIKLNFNY